LVFGLLIKTPLCPSALGSGFEAAAQLVAAFQIRNAATSWAASAKPLPPAAGLTAASLVKNSHPKQKQTAS